RNAQNKVKSKKQKVKRIQMRQNAECVMVDVEYNDWKALCMVIKKGFRSVSETFFFSWAQQGMIL
ncbi:MAG: hypothetical protein WCP65_02800, partial [Bacteroidota bacterium]